MSLIGIGDIRLRPTLRAATHLEARYGFQALFAAVADGNFSVIADIVEASSDCRDFPASINGVPLARFMPNLLERLNQHVFALAGIDPDCPAPQGSGETMPFKEYHARLYKIGTGWLGWSPETTWNATAKEIINAYEGHLEMLRAIYGSADDDQNDTRPTEKPDQATFDRAGLRRLKSMGRL